MGTSDPASQLVAARTALKLLVAAGYVSAEKANDAMSIAHGFRKGPLPPAPAEAQAQGGGEVVAWHIQHEDGLVALRKRDSMDSHMREQAAADGVRIRPLVYGDTAPPSAPVGVPKVAVPADVMEARAQGRAEALAIVLGLEAETGLDDYLQSIPPGPAGEWGTQWVEAKLRELFRADDTAWSLLQEAEGEYWHNLGLREEAQRLAQQPAAVDGAMVERALAEWKRLEGHQTDAVRMSAALQEALAAQPGCGVAPPC